MHPSSNAFDRVKSLLGKLDRSIDDARRRRLTDGDDPQPAAAASDPNSSPTIVPPALPVERVPAAAAEQTRLETPPRTNSKYGRARPIRDLAGPEPSWQRA